jgi:hypothetical protein
MLKKRFFVSILSLLLLIGCAPRRAQAQFTGYVGLQTSQQTVFNNAACTGTNQTAVINNLGETQHTLFLSTSASTTFLQGWLEGSNDGVNFTRFSDEIDTNNGVPASITASGYYQVLRANFTCLPAATGHITVFYSGTPGSVGLPAGTALQSQIAKQISNGASAGSSFQSQILPPPFANSLGVLLFAFLGAGPANSTITVQCTGLLNAPTFFQTYPLATTAATNQIFTVPAAPCPEAIVRYNSGGASATTYSFEYIFSPPGTIPNAGTGTYTHVTTTTATAAKATSGFLHTLNVNTAAPGTISIFDLPTASCTGTPATNVVAVITVPAATNGLPTFTYDVNMNQGICVKASVAMDFTVSTN